MYSLSIRVTREYPLSAGYGKLWSFDGEDKRADRTKRIGGVAVELDIGKGRYRVVRRLGSGGSGTVFQGIDTVLGRAVAVKVLHDSMDVEVLRREGSALARLNHPNIVALHDLIEDAGRTYLVLELVDGYDLATWLTLQGTPGLETAVRVTRCIASALAHAHARGVIHCDLKPANVLISAGGEVKLTDFTLAGRRTANGFDGLRGASAGFAAPEQLSGGPTDGRTDVYALGTLLAFLCRGDLLQSEAGTRARATISRARQVDPADRFGSVEEFVDSLPPIAEDVTLLAPASPLPDLTPILASKPPASQRRPVVPLLVAAAAALISGAALVSRLPVFASPATITVPDLVATQQYSAEMVARSLALSPQIVRQYSTTVPAGVVLGQVPAPGTRMHPAARVRLLVSMGPAPVEVPSVSGLQQSQAVAVLKAHLLKAVVHVQDEIGSSYGLVIGQDVTAGQQRLPGTTVTITVRERPWWWIF